jgi:hypothetical protein
MVFINVKLRERDWVRTELEIGLNKEEGLCLKKKEKAG